MMSASASARLPCKFSYHAMYYPKLRCPCCRRGGDKKERIAKAAKQLRESVQEFFSALAEWFELKI